LNALSDIIYKEKYVTLKTRAKDRKEWQKLKRGGSHTCAFQQLRPT